MKQTLADALQKRGYSDLTPVQTAVTDPELDGADLLVSARTGSGKTVGFGLALGATLLGGDEEFGRAETPLALIIAPTRELALQVRRELDWLYAGAGAVLASCVGGMDMRDERRALARGAHIVVATPGRLRDHIMRGSIDLSALRAVVLDEADEMLDLGFREDLEFILDASPADRRTLLFSATVPPAIARLAQSYQKDAVRVTTLAEKSQHSDIEYLGMNVAARDAENAIINVLRFYEAPNALVFANTRAMVNRLTTRLSNRGFSVVSLSGELSQSERSHALQAMRDGRARICVATDVAARGIDLPNLDLVVHAELPSNHETLLHRSGRTGRAGRKGVSALIVPPAARKKAERLLKFAKLRATWGSAPSADEVQARDEARMMEDPAWSEPVAEDEADIVARLTARFDADQLAAAFLRLYRANRSAPEDLSDAADTAPAPRAPFGPSIWFSVSGGRAAGAEPRRLLPMICKAGGLSRDDIGAIRVRDTESFVELKAASVPGFLAALDGRMEIETGSTLTKLDAAPDLDRGPRPDARPKKGGKPRDAARAGKPPHRKPAPKAARENVETPDRAPKPAIAETPAEAPKSPPRPKPAPKPASKPRPKPQSVDWSDPSVSRRKPGAGGKPRNPAAKRPDGVVGPLKKKKPGKPGLAPAVGKPNSKKNKARRAAAEAAKATPRRKG